MLQQVPGVSAQRLCQIVSVLGRREATSGAAMWCGRVWGRGLWGKEASWAEVETAVRYFALCVRKEGASPPAHPLPPQDEKEARGVGGMRDSHQQGSQRARAITCLPWSGPGPTRRKVLVKQPFFFLLENP